MIKKCESHQKYEEKFICIHKTRLLKEGNKFSCLKCLKWKKSNNYLKSIEELEEEGRENVAKFLVMQNKIFNINNEMKQKYIQQLNDLGQKFDHYFQKLQKSITSIIEQQNQKLTQNINKANQLLNEQSVLDSQSIDNFIIFTTLNEENQQILENKYTQINNCLERQFKYEFAEIQLKVNQFTTIEFNFDSVPVYEVEQFEIQTVGKKKDQLPFCKEHQLEKNCICTHEDCLKEQKNEYICLGCAMNNHEYHYKRNFVRTLKKIKNEQSEKLKLIEEQNKIFKQEVDSRIDQELTANQQKQQEIFIGSQTIRENLKLLETKTKIDSFNQNPIYIYHSIDQKLLSYDSEMIKLEFQSKLNQLEQLQSNISKIKKEEFNQQYQNIEEQTQNLKQETFRLRQLVLQQETKISELGNELKETSNESIIAEIQKSQKFFIQESFEYYNNKSIEIKNYIKSQVESIQLNILESKQITSLQQDLKVNIETINYIKQQMETIPKSVIESEQFMTLSQDLKNTLATINQVNSQIGTVPKSVIESKEFTTFQQDLKNAQTAINQVNSQIGTIPKAVIESKEFTTLQQDLKNTQTAIIQVNSQIGTVPKSVIESKQFTTLQQDLKNSQMTINQLNSQIGTIPKSVIESKQFTTLQQDLKNSQMTINQINSQIGTVPKAVIESKEFTTLQQDLKNTQTAIIQVNSQIENVPKAIVESKQFTNLQSTIENSFNQTQMQVQKIENSINEQKNSLYSYQLFESKPQVQIPYSRIDSCKANINNINQNSANNSANKKN
ncbi:unnamed protein product (macronuclear) [Paramecium tetraurelia]|uniref:B box-type domain-containing protein n=1 Tax=Paramecium tetraurelia TaxID=5888 RepID=A0BJI8_PARTE|nr:uncharacterized protein GSPATT00029333001 [Paramecium tetraurelia]CAK58705.1 unnamed protein product [Paramecium tetraurelia]|eukprot:XP_001426103.1 hypothetical protein (macronuclear) [Paramecium tetraurelia strain d4-2]